MICRPLSDKIKRHNGKILKYKDRANGFIMVYCNKKSIIFHFDVHTY